MTAYPFGLHQDPENGAWWMLQKNAAHNAIGLPETTCPFVVPTRGECPHQVRLTGEYPESNILSDFAELLDNPGILNHFLPMVSLPTKIMVIRARPNHHRLVANLHKLSCPTANMCVVLTGPVSPIIKKAAVASLSNMGHLLIIGATDFASYKLREIVNQCLVTNTKLTIISEDDLTLSSRGGQYAKVTLEQESKIFDFLSVWGEEDEQFPTLGAYYLYNKMRGNSI